MSSIEVITPLIGGVLIGIAASGMLWTHGRIMGISGILGSLTEKKEFRSSWRLSFILGILLGGFTLPIIGIPLMELQFNRSIIETIIGGFIVGIGTTIGNGCTSGHGVCGISRFSKRSLVATITFMIFGILTVTIIRFLREV